MKIHIDFFSMYVSFDHEFTVFWKSGSTLIKPVWFTMSNKGVDTLYEGVLLQVEKW